MTVVVVAVLVVVGVAVLGGVPPARGGAARSRVVRSGRRERRRRPDEVPDLGVLVTEVASRLRTGTDVEHAWAAAVGSTGVRRRTGPGAVSPLPMADRPVHEDAVPAALADLVTHLSAVDGSPWRRRPGTPAARAALPATVAACRLSHQLGAPLADVLDRCAQGLTESGQAAAARSIALAGPRASARLLGWLPVVGLLMGSAVGADPVGVLLGGGPGTALLLGGVGLMLAGRRWVAVLERRAGAAGAP